MANASRWSATASTTRGRSSPPSRHRHRGRHLRRDRVGVLRRAGVRPFWAAGRRGGAPDHGPDVVVPMGTMTAAGHLHGGLQGHRCRRPSGGISLHLHPRTGGAHEPTCPDGHACPERNDAPRHPLRTPPHPSLPIGRLRARNRPTQPSRSVHRLRRRRPLRSTPQDITLHNAGRGTEVGLLGACAGLPGAGRRRRRPHGSRGHHRRRGDGRRPPGGRAAAHGPGRSRGPRCGAAGVSCSRCRRVAAEHLHEAFDGALAGSRSSPPSSPRRASTSQSSPPGPAATSCICTSSARTPVDGATLRLTVTPPGSTSTCSSPARGTTRPWPSRSRGGSQLA